MIVTLTRQQMLQLWRRRLGLDFTTADATVERFDGIDMDACIESRMRSWYLDLLLNADPARLQAVDLSMRVKAPVALQWGGGELFLPDDCVRPLSLSLRGWHRNVAVEQADSPRGRDRLRLCVSKYSCPGPADPLALQRGRRIIVAPVLSDEVDTFSAIIDPGNGSYTLDEALLDTIPDHLF